MARDPGEAARILVVDDDLALADVMADLLCSAGYRVALARSGLEATARLEDFQPRLIILDLMLPDVDGLVLCTILKARAAAVPIVVCSGTGRQRDAVLSLKLGADDFVAKPFNSDVLLARIEAILRRVPVSAAPATPPTPSSRAELRVGSLLIETARQRVLLRNTPVPVTPTEYRLLAALAARPDTIVSRDHLAEQVWGYAEAGHRRSIDVHVRRLRLKLAQARPAPSILSVRGFGYKLVPESHATSAA